MSQPSTVDQRLSSDASAPRSGWGALRQPSGGARTRLVTALQRLTQAMAMLVAVAPPALYLAFALTNQRSELRTDARYLSHVVSDLVIERPATWSSQQDQLNHILTLAEEDGVREEGEARIILDSSGRVLAASAPEPGWPRMEERYPVESMGARVGEVAVVVSLVAMLESVLAIALISIATIGLAYGLLRSVPRRMLDDALRQVLHLASHDTLTGLPNRSLFMERLEGALAGLRRDAGARLALLCLDLDRFKEVNDTLGHAMGDTLLRQVSARLRAELREADTLARLGGDEFAIILPRLSSTHHAEILAQRLVQVLEEPFDLGRHQVRIGVSLGIAVAQRQDDATPETLLRDGDLALYAAKREGRGTFRFFAEEMNAALRQRRALEADLRAALALGQFALHYQPQVELAGGGITGVEALLRWYHPTRGMVLPDRYIPLAEEIGLLPRIGAWVLKEACATASRWPGMRMAVNVSAHQIHAGGFETLVARALEESGLPPAQLEIEITEGVLLTQTEATLATLERIRALGVSIAMDDFGTGYSSLGYLQRFRFDKLKIDRSFVASLDDERSRAIVQAVLGVAHALGMRANAEGVETAEQARLLSAEGCDEAQGWLYGRAVPAEEIDAMLAQKASAAAAE